MSLILLTVLVIWIMVVIILVVVRGVVRILVRMRMMVIGVRMLRVVFLVIMCISIMRSLLAR